MRSGQSVLGFCRDRGLHDSQFFKWKKRIEENESSKFVEVHVAATEDPVQSVADKAAIEIRLRRGRSLFVEPGFDASHLRALLAILETEA
jgi:transposase-like protein